MLIEATPEDLAAVASLARRLDAIMLTATDDAPIARQPRDRLRRATTVLSSLDRRNALFSEVEGRDPGWAMLLELYVANRTDAQVSVSSLCIASRAPSTTALRWQGVLVDAGLCERHADDQDGRRVHVRLTEHGLDLVEQWLDGWRD